MRESDIERAFCAKVKASGLGEVRKVKWINRAHAPDRVWLRPEAPNTIWIEFKAPGIKPRPGQLREHARMRKNGQIVVVIDSLKEVQV